MKKDQVRVITGDDHFTRRRFVQEWSSFLAGKGFTTLELDPDDNFEDYDPTQEVFFQAEGSVRRHLVVPVWEVSPLLKSGALPDSLFLTFNLDRLPRTKEFKATLEMFKVKVQTFDNPPPWKAEEHAITFMVNEAKRMGMVLTNPLAYAWASRVGYDPGVLRFELQKAQMVCPSGNLDARVVHAVIAPLLEMDILALPELIASLDRAKVSNTLRQYKDRSPIDPTLKVIRFLTPTVTRWLLAESLSRRGKAPEEAARICGINAWVYKNKILPPAQSLGPIKIRQMIHVLSSSETDFFQGAVDPWNALVSRILLWCHAVES